MNNGDVLLDQIIKLKMQLRELFLQHFTEYELFSWVWWLLIALTIVPLVIWWKYVDKKRLLEICFFGLLISICSVFLDVSGSEFVLWEYPVHLIPQLPIIIPIDFIILPVTDMLVYQRYSKWSKFLIVSLIVAAIQSFIAEPMAVWIGQYKLIEWKYIYSFPIYFIMAICAKLVTQRFKKIQDLHNRQ